MLVIYGKLDAVVGGCATGWAFDPSEPSRRVYVDLFLDGKFHDTVCALAYRSDLELLGLADGFHAFRYPLPAVLLDGEEHRVAARISHTREELAQSPRTLVIGAAGAAAASISDPELAMDATRIAGRMAPRLTRRERTKGVRLPSRASRQTFGGISVIIPTYNRGALVEETLRVSNACTEDADVEFIVIDDGSRDDTPERLARLSAEMPNLQWRSVSNRGQGQARNGALALAKHDIILFQGDDIRPSCSRFYHHHLHAHRQVPADGVAVLGKLVWPDTPAFPVNFVMSHIQGRGHQQFGYYSLEPYRWLDWRFFYTSNVSMKKALIPDWDTHGFSPAFGEYGWEDAELAYRVSRRSPDGFGCLYCPAPAATHHHIYTARQFVRRQASAGRSARRFAELHPPVRRAIGVLALDEILHQPDGPGERSLAELIAMIEAIKSWPAVLEAQGSLGSEFWHHDLLAAVFHLSFLEGYLMSVDESCRNLAGGYRYILTEFEKKLGTAPAYEAFGRFPPFTVVPAAATASSSGTRQFARAARDSPRSDSE